MKAVTLLVSVLSLSQVVTTQLTIPYRLREINNNTVRDGAEPRIYGGAEAEEGEFPYMVFILMRIHGSKLSQCSASLIRPDFVLLAAHCVYHSNFKPEDVIVIGQKANLKPYMVHRLKMKFEDPINQTRFNVQERRVYKIYKHPNYNDKTLEHDVALLHLEKAFDIKSGSVQTTKISREEMKYQKHCTILGWGLNRGNLMTFKLNFVNNRQVSTPKLGCISKHKGPFICLRSAASGICQGDSGSPLMCHNEVCGVASHLIRRSTRPDCGDSIEEYYSDIHYDFDWVQGVLNGGSKSGFVSFGSLLVCLLIVVSSSSS